MIPIPVEVEPQRPRRVYILPRDIDKYGASKGCEGCQHRRAGMASRNHNDECRKRMEESIAGDSAETHRTKRARQRETEYIINQQEAEEIMGKEEAEPTVGGLPKEFVPRRTRQSRNQVPRKSPSR